MKYYYKVDKGECLEICPIKDKILMSTINNMNHKCRVGSYFCSKCSNCVVYNEKEKYVVCSKLIKYKRLERLEKLEKFF